MTDVVRASFAAHLAALRTDIARSWAPLAPDAAFALWADRAAASRLAGPDLVAPQPELLSQLRWHEAPVLAAAGYYLDLGVGGWKEAADCWLRGAQVLIQRDPFFADRSTFVFRPVELLGVALAARVVSDADQRARRWLAGVLRDARFRPSDSRWAWVLAALATSVVMEDQPLISPAGEPTELFDIALTLWLHDARPDTAAGTDLDVLRRQFLERVAVETVDGPDNARRAVLWIAVDSAVRSLLGAAVAPGAGASPADQVVNICRRFPGVVRDLENRQRGKAPFVVHDEYDVQDLLFALLHVHFPDLRREEPTPSHAGLRPRIDFLLKHERVVVETKMTRTGLTQRAVAEEISVDKESYRSHPHARTAVFFVYDPNHRLTNPAALESEMSNDDGRLRTIVVVSPDR